MMRNIRRYIFELCAVVVVLAVAGVVMNVAPLSAQKGSSKGGAAGPHTHGASDIASETVATARLGSGTANGTTFLRGDQVWASPTAAIGAVGFVLSGGGSAITTGLKVCVPVEYSGTITQATMIADQSGSIVVDVWKDTYANYQPTDADSITASAPPTISAALKSQDSTLTGWTTAIAAGNILCANVDSATTVTWVVLSLKVQKD